MIIIESLILRANYYTVSRKKDQNVFRNISFKNLSDAGESTPFLE